MYYFIVNEHGGSGKAVRRWDIVRQILEDERIPYEAFVPEYVGHATELARAIARRGDGDIRLVVVGGDGTINEVLNGVEDFSRIKFGLIPTGSGNDFSRGLKLPRHNPRKALRIILASDGTKKIDLGLTETFADSADAGTMGKPPVGAENPGRTGTDSAGSSGANRADNAQSGANPSDSTGESRTGAPGRTAVTRRLFGISSGFGLDAVVGTGINDAKIKIILNKLHMGKLSYAFLTVQTLFSMTTHDVTVRFDGEPPVPFKKLIFLAAMNFRAEGGGVPMAPRARGDDALLSVCIASDVPKWLALLKFPFLVLGLHEKMKCFKIRTCRTLELTSGTPSIVHTDGEPAGTVRRVRFSCLPAQVTVLV